MLNYAASDRSSAAERISEARGTMHYNHMLINSDIWHFAHIWAWYQERRG